MIGCGSKDGHQQDMCVKWIGSRVYNVLTVLSSIVKITGGDLYYHLIRKKNYTFIVTSILNHAENGYMRDLDLIITLHVSYPMRIVSRTISV